jgi:hypothetical protein
MPQSIDWPRTRPPRRRRRFVLILAVLIGVVFGGRTALSYYVDALWFESVGYRDVFWKTLGLQWEIFTGPLCFPDKRIQLGLGSMSKIDQQLRLPCGRLLGYEEYGTPDGNPIFYFHGSPSTRLEWRLFGSEELANKLNIRVIVPDRPGLGRSEFQPGRRIGTGPTMY